jgi:cobalt/nickel transport system permease protein
MTDALLSPGVGLGFHAASASLLVSSARRAAREEGYDRRLPLMGVLGAFVFAAQMVNFAVPGTGSSGHLAGGTLLAILLGPSAAFVVLASVLLVQALFFGDGGLLAFGCNLFNLGFWPAFVALPLHRRLARSLPGAAGQALAPVLAAVVAVELGAVGVVAQTQLSGRADLSASHLAALLLGIHLPIGLVEGIVTASVVRFVVRLAPERIAPGARHGARVPLLVVAAGAAAFLATVGASLASTRPDGLEWSLARALRAEPARHQTGLAGWLDRAGARLARAPRPEEPGPAPVAGTPGLVGAALLAAAVALGGALVARAVRGGRGAGT